MLSQIDKISTINKFNGNDFSVWKAQVESILEAKDLASVLDTTKPRRSDKSTEAEKAKKELEILEWEKKDKQAKSLLLLSLDNKHVRLILKCKTKKQNKNTHTL